MWPDSIFDDADIFNALLTRIAIDAVYGYALPEFKNVLYQVHTAIHEPKPVQWVCSPALIFTSDCGVVVDAFRVMFVSGGLRN